MKQMTSDKSKAVIYARVSSKEQEREGFSIPAQLELLHSYARSKGFEVVLEFKDIETAKAAGRGEFNRMVEYVKDHRIRLILVEKTDRLYRNFRDYVTLEEIDVQVHLVKEGEVISRDSRSHVKFIHGIKVLMAKNYIDNLREETAKGMLQKATQGHYPCKAPMGYMNMNVDGKKFIQPDPEKAWLIIKIFERYASGRYSLKDIVQLARDNGLSNWVPSQKVYVSYVHKILKNPMYYGWFRWSGKMYKGVHEPLVTKAMWDRVQTMLAAKSHHGPEHIMYRWAFQGMVRCGHCGCKYTTEKHKGKYIYYHCTGHRGKCPEKWVQEPELEEQFGDALAAIRFDDEVMEWIVEALKGSHVDQQKFHEEAIALLEEQHKKLQRRLDRMYVDKLDGKVTDEFYDEKCSEWHLEQDEIRRNIDQHRAANRTYLEEGLKILELAQRASFLYEQQDVFEKRRLLEFVVSNSIYKDGRLTVQYRKPFNLMADANIKYKEERNVSLQKNAPFPLGSAKGNRTPATGVRGRRPNR
jgi:site-specific DNA recombinase